MTDDSGRKRAAAETFDEHASAYVESAVHRAGDDLDTLAEWCADADRALDVATGAGHTAGAVLDRGAAAVVATDAAPEMVRTAETEFPGVQGVVADAERLPFDADSFDAVTCRIAAHHFPDPEAFVEEVSRVTEPGGVFAFEDNIAPEDDDLDSFLNRVERLRDPSHGRSHRESEWREWVDAAGFSVEETLVVKKTIDYRDWVIQLDTPEENRRELESLFADPPDGASDLYDVTHDEDGMASFANLKVLLRARR
ncbi:class I SAM-dependent methyltransferase [Haloarchaeobius sp. HRN-SO-5]|uniref:class I SAM-dependent methyltransferase n=1 Tax=Haloarchaeobius sp. HRN-SO-5 TaxID=3446118 RepID=UPI003EBA9331